MAIRTNSFDGGANATAIAAGTSGGASGDAFDVVSGGPQWATSAAKHGALGMNSSGGQQIVQWNFSDLSALARVYFRYVGSLPTDGAAILRFQGGSNAALNLQSNGTMQLYNAGSKGTAPSALSADTWYRAEVHRTATTLQWALYAGDDTTAIYTSPLASGMTNAETTQVLFGKYESTANTVVRNIDSVGLKTGADAVWGAWPFTTPLATPTVTLGAKTTTSTVGGTDGTQIVTWATVPNAASYEALIANTATPSPSDFTVIATGVTSPYKFTGLAAGTHSYGIRAKA